MTVYITVGARRIQSWMVRTPMLALVRGASRALAAATTPVGTGDAKQDRLAAWLVAEFGDRVRVVDDVGRVSGRVVLALAEPDADPDARRRAARAVAERLAAYLQLELPGLEWGVQVREAASAAEAIAADHGAGSAGTLSLTLLPTGGDVPLASACQTCELEPAVTGQTIPVGTGPGAEERRIGRDCFARWTAKPPETSDPPPGTLVEATKIEDLARLGAPADDSRSFRENRELNHVATICADGNRMGAAFAEFGAFPVAFRESAVRAVDDAVHFAVRRARDRTVASSPPAPKYFPDLPHYLGGDDILVTVAARYAWRYAIALCEEFRTQLALAWRATAHRYLDPAQRSRVDELAETVGLGVGIAFTHQSHPFSDAFQHGERAQAEAKRGARGQFAAISWVDLTAEDRVPAGRWAAVGHLVAQLDLTDRRLGDQPGTGANPDEVQRWRQGSLLLDLPDGAEGSGDGVGWTNSQRARVAEILRDGWPAEARRRPRAEVDRELAGQLRDWSARAGDRLWGPLASGRGATNADVADLADLLNRQRWWPQP